MKEVETKVNKTTVAPVISYPWCLGNFWGVIEVPRLEKGARYIFLSKRGSDLQGGTLREGSHGGGLTEGAVLPFALPAGDQAAMMIYDCVRIGCLGNPDPDDVRLLMSNSTLSFYSLEGEDGQERKLQHESPALSFPPLFTLDPRVLFLVAPDREDLNPHFEDFNVYFTIHEDADLSDPLTVCLVLDVYIPSALQAKRSAAEFERHMGICDRDISAIENDLGFVEPEDVETLYRDRGLAIVSVGGDDSEQIKAHMDSVYMNLRITNALGYHTPDQKERYLKTKARFFELQKEHKIFYLDDSL